jgi:hypothetical protein
MSVPGQVAHLLVVAERLSQQAAANAERRCAELVTKIDYQDDAVCSEAELEALLTSLLHEHLRRDASNAPAVSVREEGNGGLTFTAELVAQRTREYQEALEGYLRAEVQPEVMRQFEVRRPLRPFWRPF